MMKQSRQFENENKYILLVCTVGGSSAPIIKSISHWKPDKVIFIVSKLSRASVDSEILHQVKQKYDIKLSPAQYDISEIRNADDFKKTFVDISKLQQKIEEWNNKDSCKTIVDITGGTKGMSASLALAAKNWECKFSYVGGDKRTKEGTGIVEDGSEIVYDFENPILSLGRKYIDDAVLLFNNRQYSSASALLDHARKTTDIDDSIKKQFSVLVFLADGYRHWDSFQHNAAASKFKKVLKNLNDFNAVIPNNNLKQIVESHEQLCITLAANKGKPNELLIHDLIANAGRRAFSGQFDDGVARLYRACEAIAQLALSKYPGFEDTGNIRLEALPETLQKQWSANAKDGAIQIGLRSSYKLLKAKDDSKGKIFFDSVLSNLKKSPLTSRNQSILAHGFAPCSEHTYNNLYEPIYELAGKPDLNNFQFPKLPQ